MNPDKLCNFDCSYCEVDRDTAGSESSVDLRVLEVELESLLELSFQGRLRQLPYFANLPDELLKLRGVALSGDGEPTLSAQFEEIVAEVIHMRSRSRLPFYKIVLITNCTGLDRPEVRSGLSHLTPEDEIWCKLDAGTQAYMDLVNRSGLIRLQQILENILHLARQRPVVIQSLFPLIDGQEPPRNEVEEYVLRLKELSDAGAHISQVQIYSAHRAPHRPNCGHLPLRCLSAIACRVREVTGLKAEVF
jgi:wyosine [tRNA(Phe)-imidazoG37] synthetase (radical SAM superfamily)